MRRGFRTTFCSTGAVAVILLASATAHADEMANGDQSNSPSASASGAPAGSEGVEHGVEEIIVTAQRREESVQRASISIAAVTSETLAQRGVTDSQSLNGVVAGLKISYSGTAVQTFVRGVGDVTGNQLTQPSVSLNMDGVNLSRSAAFGPVFFDTARVEVLRGPQGTLYGRNSTGGAINVISNAPKLNETSGYLVGEIGNYGLQRFQGAVNIPTSDTLALRLATQVTDRSGYSPDGENDDKSLAGRLRALWQPSSDLTVNVIVEGAHSGGQGFGRVYRPALFGNPWTAANDPRINPTTFPLVNNRAPAQESDIDYFGASAQIDWRFGGTTLTVLPAYKYVHSNTANGADFGFTDVFTSKVPSLEVRLAGNTDSLKWVIGAFGLKERLSSFNFVDLRKAATLTGRREDLDYPHVDAKTAAVFGEGTLSLTDAFRVLAGVRYTYERRTRDGNVFINNYTAGVVTSSSVNSFPNLKLDLNEVTWRTGFEFDIARSNMLYATVSKGVKSGGFNTTDSDPFFPEFLTAYTIGSKNRFFNNALQLNLEGFYWQYKDQQFGFLGLNTAGLPTPVTKNAGQSNIYGFDIDVVWQPTGSDTLTFAAEYLHAKFNSFKFTTLGAFPAGTVLSDGCVSDGLATTTGFFVENCSGQPLPRAPKFSGNARYTHRFDLGGDNSITVGGTTKFESTSYLFFNYTSPNFKQKAYALFDADITYNAGDRWSLQAWIRNIGNKPVYLSGSTESSIAPTSGVDRGAIAAIGAPRTYGVRIKYNF